MNTNSLTSWMGTSQPEVLYYSPAKGSATSDFKRVLSPPASNSTQDPYFNLLIITQEQVESYRKKMTKSDDILIVS